MMDKTAQRRALVAARLNLPDRVQRADALQMVLLQWLQRRSDSAVGAYWPIKGEFDPLPALQQWQQENRQLRKIALPLVDTARKQLRFHIWYPECHMQEDAYGIPTPQGTPPIVPTLLLVPCVGYSADGWRLGYGGGFYDRTLAGMHPPPISVGLGYSAGLLERFRPEPHDVPLDVILNENGTV